MRKNPERLAWVVLLTSFFICIGLTAAIPLGVRAFILFSQVGQNVTLEVQRGSLRVLRPRDVMPIAIAEDHDNIPERTVVTTDLTQGRLVMYSPENDNPISASVQLYNNTRVILSMARSPRFSISQLPHQVAMEMTTGRVRINVFDTQTRPTVAEVQTPHGTITLVQGSYEVKVNTNTEVTVRYGKAEIQQGQSVLTLAPAQRATVSFDSVSEPLPATRNLVTNGDFKHQANGWANDWERYSDQTDPGQPKGSVTIVVNEGREVIDFYREGSNHAEVGIRQEIDYDVRDFTSLELHLAVRIISEDILGYGGCGYRGYECPIIALIKYKDINGNDNEWLQGFYIGAPKAEEKDKWPIYGWAISVQEQSWQTYDSTNLMEELSSTPPVLIKSLTIYASGHSFHAMVTEVELLAQE